MTLPTPQKAREKAPTGGSSEGRAGKAICLGGREGEKHGSGVRPRSRREPEQYRFWNEAQKADGVSGKKNKIRTETT